MAKSVQRLLTTLPLLTRDKDTAAMQLLRALPLQTGVARQCPTLSHAPSEQVFSSPLPDSYITANRSPTGMFGQTKNLGHSSAMEMKHPNTDGEGGRRGTI